MPHPNSVLALRASELARSTREFRARGSRVIRCETCLLAVNDCICALRPQVDTHCAFLFLMYHGEAFKPSNTGRLIADVVRDNHAFLWHRLEHDAKLLALLRDPQYAPILIFPHQYAEQERCIDTPAQVPAIQAGRKPLFVMLDGTWREAKKMFKSPYLADLPVLGIHPEKASAYLMRDAAHLHQLCTAEVAIEVLRLAGEEAASSTLAEYFEAFCRHYIMVKPHALKKVR